MGGIRHVKLSFSHVIVVRLATEVLVGGMLHLVAALLQDLKTPRVGSDRVNYLATWESLECFYAAICVKGLHDVQRLSDHILEELTEVGTYCLL